ncbi:MAG: DUF1015 domain-containing protein [Chloroflexota bacterium]
MAEIRPFRGVRYNPEYIPDISRVLCPPYDIISPARQQELYQRSEYNFIRIEYNHELARDTAADNRYSRAAATLEQWLREGILKADDAPAVYLHDHYFSHSGERRRRRGLTVIVRLEEWSRMVVRPHEGTLSRPRGDRLNLLWALQANTSPVLTLYHDPRQQMARLLAEQSEAAPRREIAGFDGEEHHLQAITDMSALRAITRMLADQPLYIADGHHRYESALTYRQGRIACTPGTSGEEAYNFVLMTLVDFDDHGLLILPAHRLVGGMTPSSLEGLAGRLETFFAIEEAPLHPQDIQGQVAGLLAGEGIRLLLFGMNRGSLLALRLKDGAAAAGMMPYFHSEHYKELPVSVLDHVILEKLLGVGNDEERAVVDYRSDPVEAIQMVMEREYQLAFLLNPVTPRSIQKIADAGDRMPRKSTYFYPKLPSGLVLYRHA